MHHRTSIHTVKPCMRTDAQSHTLTTVAYKQTQEQANAYTRSHSQGILIEKKSLSMSQMVWQFTLFIKIVG